ncbi:MAG: HVO_A0114 family putative DNA-binding protein, partial [Devosia sp.]
YQGEFQGFASMEQLFEVLTPKRWALIQKLQAIGPSSLRGLARALGRDVKRVHADAAALLGEGIIERNAEGRLFVPFETIRIDIELKAPPAKAS